MKKAVLVFILSLCVNNLFAQNGSRGKAMEDVIIYTGDNYKSNRRAVAQSLIEMEKLFTPLEKAQSDREVKQAHDDAEAKVELYKSRAEAKMSIDDYGGAILDFVEALRYEYRPMQEVMMQQDKAHCYEKLRKFSNAAYTYQDALVRCYDYKDENRYLTMIIPQLYYYIGINFFLIDDYDIGCHFLNRATELGYSYSENITKSFQDKINKTCK
ncbi:MAG TPA: hypothetical protein VI757_14835 [Bacteroidia bacterium]|nr:hypothetical protein [Bacteroidia bacterium]